MQDTMRRATLWGWETSDYEARVARERAEVEDPLYILPDGWEDMDEDSLARFFLAERIQRMSDRATRSPVGGDPHAAPKGDWAPSTRMPTVDDWLLRQHGRELSEGEIVEYEHASPMPEQFAGHGQFTVYHDAEQAAGYTIYTDDGEPLNVDTDPVAWDEYPSSWDTPAVRATAHGAHEWKYHSVEGFDARKEAVAMHMLEWLLDAEEVEGDPAAEGYGVFHCACGDQWRYTNALEQENARRGLRRHRWLASH